MCVVMGREKGGGVELLQPGVWLLKDFQPKGEGVLHPLKCRPRISQTEQG